MTVIIRAALATDAPAFAAALRPADRLEAEASGQPVLATIQVGIGLSAQVFCAWDDDKPLAIWGYMQPSLLHDTAGVWLLTCTEIERHKVAFVRVARAQIAIWLAAGPTLAGMVDQRHATAMRWLARERFEFDAATVRLGPDRLPFLRFRRDA